MTAVVLEAKRAGMAPTLIKSEKRQHVDSRGQPTFEPSTEVGILESLRQDVYLVLHGVSGDDRETAEIRITFNPLVWWVWYGGIIMAIGGLIVMWPQATRGRRQASRRGRVRRGDAAIGASHGRRPGAAGRSRGLMATRRQFVITLGGAVVAVAARGRARSAGRGDARARRWRATATSRCADCRAPRAAKRLTPLERDAVERMLSCPCPCTLDVFTCRTSMPCGFSPRLHADVVQLANGGYSADEILAAFEQAYGEKILMAPHKQGFNWVGWIAPFAAVGGGALCCRGADSTVGATSGRAPVDGVARADRSERRRNGAARGRDPERRSVTALVVGAALAVAALIYVLFPLFDVVAPLRSRLTAHPWRAPESAIDALREIEFDRATGKLSDEDYTSLKAAYTRSALVELRSRRG